MRKVVSSIGSIDQKPYPPIGAMRVPQAAESAENPMVADLVGRLSEPGVSMAPKCSREAEKRFFFLNLKLVEIAWI